jgi:hypothetical protein
VRKSWEDTLGTLNRKKPSEYILMSKNGFWGKKNHHLRERDTQRDRDTESLATQRKSLHRYLIHHFIKWI